MFKSYTREYTNPGHQNAYHRLLTQGSNMHEGASPQISQLGINDTVQENASVIGRPGYQYGYGGHSSIIQRGSAYTGVYQNR